MYKIIIADDNDTFRKGLRFYVEQILGHTIIGESNNGEDLLKLNNLQLADLILIDIEMPQLNGVDVTRRLTWMYRDIKVIAITSYSEKVYLQQLIGAGFKGYILKKSIHDELPEAINRVFNNEYYFNNKDLELSLK